MPLSTEDLFVVQDPTDSKFYKISAGDVVPDTYWETKDDTNGVTFIKPIDDNPVALEFTSNSPSAFVDNTGMGQFPSLTVHSSTPGIEFADTSGISTIDGTYVRYSSSNGLGGELTFNCSSAENGLMSFRGNDKRLMALRWDVVIDDSYLAIGNLDSSTTNPNIALYGDGRIEAKLIDCGEYAS